MNGFVRQTIEYVKVKLAFSHKLRRYLSVGRCPDTSLYRSLMKRALSFFSLFLSLSLVPSACVCVSFFPIDVYFFYPFTEVGQQ